MAKLNAKGIAKSLVGDSGFVENQVSVDEAAILENLGFRAFKMTFDNVPPGVTLQVDLPNGASPDSSDRLMTRSEVDANANIVSATILQAIERKTRPAAISIRACMVENGRPVMLGPFKVKITPQEDSDGSIVLVGELAL